jgi:hypothetical protein
MGADSLRSFSAIIAAKRAEFISYRETMEKLAAYTGNPLSDIASVLKHELVAYTGAAYLSGKERKVTRSESGNTTSLADLLDWTIEHGEVPEGDISEWLGITALSDGDGWIRDELIANLQALDLPCPDSLRDASASPRATSPQSASDADLMARVRAVEDERDGLAREVADLSTAAFDRDNLKEQVSALEARVRELSGLLDAANTKIAELSSDEAKGKTKTAMLQVIGGLVQANTDMDIYAERLDGFDKLYGDLQTVGVTVRDDAIRKYLKAAAGLLEKPAS